LARHHANCNASFWLFIILGSNESVVRLLRRNMQTHCSEVSSSFLSWGIISCLFRVRHYIHTISRFIQQIDIIILDPIIEYSINIRNLLPGMSVFVAMERCRPYHSRLRYPWIMVYVYVYYTQIIQIIETV
jgi:hypothetical protein